MKKLCFDSFQAWVKEACPELELVPTVNGTVAITFAGLDGPTIFPVGLELLREDSEWDEEAQTIESTAELLSDSEFADEIDFTPEVEELKAIAKRVREKLVKAGKNAAEDKSDPGLIYGNYPNGREWMAIPFEEENTKIMEDIVREYYEDILLYSGEVQDEQPRLKIGLKEFLEKE